MKCDEARDRMVFHVDGEDDEVGAHLRDCAACRAVRDDVAAERATLKRALAADVASVRRPARRRPLIARRPLVWPFAAAAAAAAAILALGILQARRPPPPEPETVTQRREPPPIVSTPALPTPAPTPAPPPVVPSAPPEPPAPPVPVPTPEPLPLPPPTPAPVEPSPKPDPLPPTTPERPVQVALTLERGTPQDLKWEGARVFAAGERISARTALRIAWGGATLYVKETSSLVIADRDAFALESGAVLVENLGAPITVRTPHGTLRDVGTRFSVSIAGRETETVVHEGRVLCETKNGSREAAAGERATLKDSAGPVVEPARDAGAYPAWVARAAAIRTPVATWTFDKPDRKVQGIARDGSLHAVVRDEVFSAGLESEGPIFTVPARGEFWVTYASASAELITLRCRALVPETTAFDFVIAKPVRHRPVQMRVPLERFTSERGRALAAGDRVHIVYVWTRDAESRLRIDDLSIVQRRD